MTVEGSEPAEAANTGDLDRLRELFTASERRAATLAELTALMSKGRDPLALAQRSVELTARATRATEAFVFLWDRESELLVLRAATEGYHRNQLNRVRLRMGEGVTGWVALMREPLMIPDAPYKDPRFKTFPEMREKTFKSMVAVPIVAPGEDVLGVFTLYSVKKHSFQTSDVNLATEVGSLLASGLVQAETLSQLKVQSAAAQYLRLLPDETWGSLEHCLRAMATQCATDLQADVCLIEVTPDHSQPQNGTHGVGISQSFRENAGSGLVGKKAERATVLPLLEELNFNRLRIPLGATAPIGAVTCFRERRFTSDDELLLEGIGAQIAAGALSLYGRERARPMLEQLYSSPDPATTEALLKRYGWKSRPGWATAIKLQTTPSTDLRTPDEDRIRAALEDVYSDRTRGFLVIGGGNQYLALASGDALLRDVLTERLQELGAQPMLRLSAGVSPIAQDTAELRRAMRHALYCTHWAELVMPAESGVVRYEEVASLRLLPKAAVKKSEVLSRLIDSLAEVVKYDLENGTDLAQTLDVFLANSGSAAKSAAELFIHRNTLRQRIQRVEELIGQSPEEFEDWVTAGLAVRVARESESELGSSRPASHRCPHGVLTIGRACCGMASNCVHLSAGASRSTARP